MPTPAKWSVNSVGTLEMNQKLEIIFRVKTCSTVLVAGTVNQNHKNTALDANGASENTLATTQSHG